MAEQTSSKERFVAKKLWIAELLSGEFENSQNETAALLKTARGNASRVNIIGVVIGKEELPVSTIIVDDGTGQATFRSFERPIHEGIGAIVQIVGRPRAYQGSIYVSLEHASKIDPGWAEYRKMELGSIKANTHVPIKSEKESELIEENNAEKLLRFIKQLDDGEGADIDAVIEASKIPNAESIINQMLMHGDVFELRPGRIKPL